MSADKRRKILIGFAGLAVVLVVVITYVSPTFRNENASGAIAPVQKHRAPQIAQGDVVLGSEQVKQAQKIVYGDFLSDAATLRNLSTEALALKRLEAANLDSFSRSLRNQDEDVQAAYIESMTEAIGVAAALAQKARLANVEAEAVGLKAMIANKRQLANEEMAALNQKFAGVVAQLESADAVASYDNVRQHLAKAASYNQQSQLNAVRNDLERAWSQYNGLATLDLQYHVDHLEALAAENKWIANAENVLDNRSKMANAFDEIAGVLGKAALALETQALDNMKELASDFETEAALANEFEATLNKMSSFKNRDSAFDQALAVMSVELKRRDNVSALERQSQLQMVSEYLAAAAQENRAHLANFDQYTVELKKLERQAALASAMR
jgi:hypothetical protein